LSFYILKVGVFLHPSFYILLVSFYILLHLDLQPDALPAAHQT